MIELQNNEYLLIRLQSIVVSAFITKCDRNDSIDLCRSINEMKWICTPAKQTFVPLRFKWKSNWHVSIYGKSYKFVETTNECVNFSKKVALLPKSKFQNKCGAFSKASIYRLNEKCSDARKMGKIDEIIFHIIPCSWLHYRTLHHMTNSR